MAGYDYGGYERQKNDIYHKYGTDATTNAYGRFISQQRGERSLGDQSRQFGRDMPTFKASFGARGLSGPGVQSGTMQNSMNQFVGDYTRNYGRAQQDLTSDLQNYDLQQGQLDAWRQQSLASLEAQKAAGIAADAQNIEWLRQQLGGT